ncbi:EAL domain-containing protein [Acidithiobacillus acidisediminis]|uniref:EAL domain-containing protein n=1 Tax=Acidithiobacillus acidisediminis TaxID=2937799 RepID=UPI00200E63DA|nr:EAL domain-containing protein [Acidithiobacillus sp. S30A2]
MRQFSVPLSVLIEAIPDAVFWKDGQGRWLLINHAAKALFRLEDLSWVGKTNQELAELHPEFRGSHLACVENDEKTWQTGKPIVVVETMVGPHGTLGVFEVRKIPVFSPQGEREGLLVLRRDITTQKRLEEKLRRQVEIQEQITQYNRLLGEVNETIAQEVSTEALLQRICELAIAYTPTVLAWIAQPDAQGWFQKLAAAGRTVYLQAVRISTRADIPEGQGPAGSCWRKQAPTFSYVSDDSMALWQDRARQFGLVANSVIPIFRNGKIWGIFGIHLSQKTDFTPELRDVLKELGQSISFGLDHLDALQRERRLIEEIKAQAISDALTDIPNRRALDQELDRALSRANRRERLLALCIIDLDDFKPVNDTHGHDVGDLVLVTIARRLQETLRASDFIARLGGDEFVCLLEELERLDDLEVSLRHIIAAVQSPVVLDSGQEVRVGLSIGVAIHYGDDPDEGRELLRVADQALYQIKAQKTDRLQPWLIAGEIPLLRHNAAQEMLKQGRVEAWYQPILSLREGRIVGVEALARLRDATGEIWKPDRFLPQLQKEELSTLTRLVLEQAIRDLRSLDDQGLKLWASVNVDPSSVSEFCITCVKERVLDGTIDPRRITLEILEGSDFQEQQEALAHLQKLKEIGVRLALDDIGSAYSSLLRIKDLPIDEIKLDQKLVRTLEDRPEDLPFVRSIQVLAQGIGVDFVVEGVETPAILRVLWELGVNLVQGYAIAKPMPLEQLRAFLQHPMELPRENPSTLLGLYVAVLLHKDMVTSAIRLYPGLLNLLTLEDAQPCETSRQLRRFFSEDPESLATLNALHEEYHRSLALVEHSALSGQAGALDWAAVDDAEQRFLRALLHAYHHRE